MSVKSPLGLVLYCYLNMPTINKTYLILSLSYLFVVYFHCSSIVWVMSIGISYSSISMHLIMVFLIKIARKITAFNKICTHHQYFFLNKKWYYEILSFLTKVGNTWFVKMDSAIWYSAILDLAIWYWFVSLCINIKKRSCCKGLHCVPGVWLIKSNVISDV